MKALPRLEFHKQVYFHPVGAALEYVNHQMSSVFQVFLRPEFPILVELPQLHRQVLTELESQALLVCPV